MGPTKIDHQSAKNHQFYLFLLYHNHLYLHSKIFITSAELNGLSSAAYGMGILHFEQKILAKI